MTINIIIVDVFSWLFPFIFAFGIVGNVISFVVFSRRQLAKKSFSVYFRFLAVSDSLALVDSLNNFAKYKFGTAFADHSFLTCKAFHYIADSMELASAWLYVAISLDRLVNLRHASKLKFMNNKLCQVAICVLIYALSLSFDIVELVHADHYWHLMQSNGEDADHFNHTHQDYNHTYNNSSSNSSSSSDVNEGSHCVWHDPDNVFTMLYLATQAILPFMLMMLLTFFIIQSVFYSRRRCSRSVSSSKICYLVKHIKRRDIRYAIVSIVMNLFFLVLNSPSNMLYAVSALVPPFDWDVPYVITISLYYSHFALIFYVNLAMNVLFRHECARLFAKSYSIFCRSNTDVTNVARWNTNINNTKRNSPTYDSQTIV